MSETKDRPVTTDLIKQAVINEVKYVLNREDIDIPEHAVFERKKHLIYSDNLSSAQRVKMIATGYPDGPLMFSRTTDVSLHKAYSETVRKGGAFAQVYLGGKPTNLNKYPKYLDRALTITGDAEIDMYVYSAGAMSLVNQNPDTRINRLTFISPFIGKESLRGDPETCATYVFGGVVDIPSIDEYLDSIDPLIEELLDKEKRVTVEVGTRDRIISSENVVEGFRGRYEDKVEVSLTDRAHAPSQNEVNKLLLEDSG